MGTEFIILSVVTLSLLILHYLDTTRLHIFFFILRHRLRPNKKVDMSKWEDDKYLESLKLESIGSEYLRQKYKIVTHREVTLEYFVCVVRRILPYVEMSDGEGFFIVKSGTKLLRPPNPPKDYPPIPEGWQII